MAPCDAQEKIRDLERQVKQLRGALQRIDAINDNPSRFDSQINEVVSAALAQPQASGYCSAHRDIYPPDCPVCFPASAPEALTEQQMQAAVAFICDESFGDGPVVADTEPDGEKPQGQTNNNLCHEFCDIPKCAFYPECYCGRKEKRQESGNG